MSFKGLVANDSGQPLVTEMLDIDTGEAVDVSVAAGFTSWEMDFKSPAEVVESHAAVLFTDGSDGMIKYVREEGVIDVGGLWYVRGRAIGSGIQLTSLWLGFKVEDEDPAA